MDFGLAFTYVFQDKDWVKKILIGAVAAFVVVIGWIPLLGWLIEIARRVIRQDPEPLADWSDLGRLFTLGIKGLAIIIIFLLPLIIFGTPLSIWGSTNDNPNAIFWVITGCVSCLLFVYAILIALVIPASIGILADTDQFGSALNPSKIFGLIKAAPAAYILALIGAFVGMFVSMFGVILCAIGLYATMAYTYAIMGHLYGQAYRQASTSVVQISTPAA